jgi:hypothetical protein
VPKLVESASLTGIGVPARRAAGLPGLKTSPALAPYSSHSLHPPVNVFDKAFISMVTIPAGDD